jgi:hypothetical protein
VAVSGRQRLRARSAPARKQGTGVCQIQMPFRSLEARTLTTLHGRRDLGDLKPIYYRFAEMPLVSVSSDQRKPLPHANFVATIHHGIPADLHRPSSEQGRYLAFLGRISPEERPDRATRIARAAAPEVPDVDP